MRIFFGIETEDMMTMKKQEIVKEREKNSRLLKMLSDEREKIVAYKQITKLYSAYISLLLEKMGATKDNIVNIKKTEVADAISRIEARAMPTEDGWHIYCEVIKEK